VMVKGSEGVRWSLPDLLKGILTNWDLGSSVKLESLSGSHRESSG